MKKEASLRLRQNDPDQRDDDPKAFACYGLWCETLAAMRLRFVAGKPVSAATCAYLAWVAEQLASAGKRFALLVWDNATWHRGKAVRAWLREHNLKAKREGAEGGGCRLIACFLLRAVLG